MENDYNFKISGAAKSVDLLKADVPNETTLVAFREGDEILTDASVKGYTNIKDLRMALEV